MMRVFFALLLSGCVSFGNPLIYNKAAWSLDVKECVDKIKTTTKHSENQSPDLALYQQCDASLRASRAFRINIISWLIVFGSLTIIKAANEKKEERNGY